ncbi:MAG TPA: nuclear transport factor 2 family protein [Puia sp.]|nr:nuclear transport factor 2 family protein [Puia sp.]
MKRQITPLLLSAAMAFHPSHAQSKFPAADIQAITETNKRYGEAFAKNDSSVFLDCYAPDGCILAPGAPALCGERSLLLFYKGAYKTGMRNIVFTSINWYGYDGQFVTEQGTYQQFDADNNPIGAGKYMVVWQRLAKGWRMLRDMFNADRIPKM